MLTYCLQKNYHVCLVITTRSNQSEEIYIKTTNTQGFKQPLPLPLGCTVRLGWFMDHKFLSTAVYVLRNCNIGHIKVAKPVLISSNLLRLLAIGIVFSKYSSCIQSPDICILLHAMVHPLYARGSYIVTTRDAQ